VSGKLAEVKDKTNAVKVKYLYDAMGNRALKWTPIKGQLYMRDVLRPSFSMGTGNELVSLENTGTNTILKEANIFGSERIGAFKPQTETEGVFTLANRTFDLKDHPGNIRATVSDEKEKSGSGFLPKVQNASEYHPFGMETDKSFAISGKENRFGYNGKENDKTIGVQDYGFRLYKPELARFLSQDPLRKDYQMLSVYAFAANSPIKYIDGLEPGLPYNSPYEAALNFISNYGKFSIQENRDYSASIVEYKNEEGSYSYSYTIPNTGRIAIVERKLPSKKEGIGVAGIHGHGSDGPKYDGNALSYPDVSGAQDHEVPEIVNFTNGQVVIYFPPQNNGIQVSELNPGWATVMPEQGPCDPNDPEAINPLDGVIPKGQSSEARQKDIERFKKENKKVRVEHAKEYEKIIKSRNSKKNESKDEP